MEKKNPKQKQVRRDRIPIRRKSNNHFINSNFVTMVDKWFDDERWEDLIGLLQRELRGSPNSHWLLTQLASAFYEKREYESAYKFIVDAVLANKTCPLALWHLACILRMRTQQLDAITVWQELLNRDFDSVALEECGEGVEWANSLLNDCRYMISKTYKDLGEIELAEKFKFEYLNNLTKGIESIYDPSTL